MFLLFTTFSSFFQLRKGHPEKGVVSSGIPLIRPQDRFCLSRAFLTGYPMCLLQEQPFNLAFLDIKMPGGDIFEVLDSLESIDFEIIFITAYDQYAIRAIRRCAIDYLMKPINLIWSISASSDPM